MTKTNQIVILAYGPQPVSFFAAAGQLAGDGAIISQDVARMAGATFAAGTPAELDALRKRLEAGALQAERNSHPTLSDAAVQWLACGERGISSNHIFTILTGVNASRFGDSRDCRYPRDPSDFRRCQLLPEAVPELQQRFYRMAKAGPQWTALVAAWPAILAAMDEEAPDWRNGYSRRASRAYELIQAAIREKATT